MGLFLRQDQGRSELQSKVIADLQQRMYDNPSLEGDKTEQVAEDYSRDQHHTRSAGLVIAILVVVLIVVGIFVVTR